MNIAMFTDAYYPRINGVAVSVKTYAEALCNLGHNVCIVCCNYEKPTSSNNYNKFYYDENIKSHPNIKILRLPTHSVVFSEEDRTARINQWHTIKREMDSFKPDIVHLNSEFVVAYFGLTYAKHRKIPIVYTFHTLWEEYVSNYIHAIPPFYSKKVVREFIRFYLKRANVIICPTQRIANVVQKYKIDRDTVILPTGIPEDIAVFKKEYKQTFFNHLHTFLPIIQKKKILLYIGRIVKEKNLDFLFDVLLKVKKSVPDTALLMVGGGPELDDLKEIAKEKKCSWDVCFTGYRSKDELAYFYSIADVFVFPSLTETQGLVTIEAMTAGLPVVAIGEMGTTDVMQGDNGGFMVKNDLDQFSEKVVELLKDNDLRKAKSEEAKEWSKHWSMSTLTPQLIQTYEKAIELKKNE